MDSKFFRKTTDPNYYAKSQHAEPRIQPANRLSLPTQDTRFPGYAFSGAEDGRMITDYRPRCSQNVPAGSQYATKNWMVHEADSIIEVSRKRQATYTGAIYGTDNSVVPRAEMAVKCVPMGCEYSEVVAGGIGVERMDKAPELFGTFSFPTLSPPPAPKTALTTHFEGGRNTVRGQTYHPLGNGPVPSPV
jgi:hypothetical protein